jgi:peptidoglycan/LPS O-acetylase OafA/YrhL
MMRISKYCRSIEVARGYAAAASMSAHANAAFAVNPEAGQVA